MGNRPVFLRLLAVVATICFVGCARHGRTVYVREGCPSCHRFHGEGGSLGPDLTGVASRRDAGAIRRQIVEPGATGPTSRMPPYRRLSWFDLRSLVAYLRT